MPDNILFHSYQFNNSLENGLTQIDRLSSEMNKLNLPNLVLTLPISKQLGERSICKIVID